MIKSSYNHPSESKCWKMLETGLSRPKLIPTAFYRAILGYLKDSNAEAHSVDSDIFYAVIYLYARLRHSLTFISLNMSIRSV